MERNSFEIEGFFTEFLPKGTYSELMIDNPL